jgi:hypothetical protein
LFLGRQVSRLRKLLLLGLQRLRGVNEYASDGPNCELLAGRKSRMW